MKKLLFLLSISLMFVSCGTKNNPVKFNDLLVDHYAEMSIIEDDFKTKLQEAYESKTYADIKKAFDEATPLMDAQIKALEAIEAPASGKEFLSSVLLYAKTVKKNMEIGNKLSDITDPFKAMSMKNDYDIYGREVTKVDKSIERTQREFAKKNNMKLE